MLKNIIFAVIALGTLLVLPLDHATAGNDAYPTCEQLDAKASGDMTKYSLHGDANGPIFFSGISCAIKHRNQELCAMEMVSFDTTAKVYDYYSGEETDIGKAYFWFDEKNNWTPVMAFSSKESADKYAAGSGSGVVLNYTELTEQDILK